MDVSIYNKTDKELLEWELSLNSSDLRSHAWYHGNVVRNVAEALLQEDGEFLVRDSSTFARSGDYVLSCQWKGVVIHFLIHKEVLQPDTIYEQLGYRFENESFTTVQDLITFYVGNREPISAKSGAIIHLPRTRAVPVSKKDRILSLCDLGDNEYVTISQEAARQVLPVDAILIEKSFTAESPYQISLNLKPPEALLESLEEIPEKVRDLESYKTATVSKSEKISKSRYDLSVFSSILLPIKLDDIVLSPSLIQIINSRILEASERAVAFHITKIDWEVLRQEIAAEDDSEEIFVTPLRPYNGIYENVLNDGQFRWNNVIERALTFSHFVAITALRAESEREKMLIFSKWIVVANELKVTFGNFYGFCNIIRGLTFSKISSPESQIDWLKLRREYTNSAFLFETTLRNSYHNILQGTESYPPNTTIPNLLPVSIILEEKLDLIPLFKNSPEQDKLKFSVAHMRQLYNFCDNEDMHVRNMTRLSDETTFITDIILTDMFKTEIHLLLLWGINYDSNDLQARCKEFDNSY